MICTMCEEEPATTTYGAPEKADPSLGKAAGEVDDAARQFFGRGRRQP